MELEKAIMERRSQFLSQLRERIDQGKFSVMFDVEAFTTMLDEAVLMIARQLKETWAVQRLCQVSKSIDGGWIRMRSSLQAHGKPLCEAPVVISGKQENRERGQ